MSEASPEWGGTPGSPRPQRGGIPAAWGRWGASGTRPAAAPLPSASASLPPGLGPLANEKEEKNKKKTLLCVKAKLGERGGGRKRRKKKKKKTTRGWSARETFDFVFSAIFFLGRKSSRGCSAEGTATSQQRPRPTQGPKFRRQRPPRSPAPRGLASKRQRSQEKLKSATVRGGGRGHRRPPEESGGTPEGCSEHPARRSPIQAPRCCSGEGGNRGCNEF